eukprot:TRINITY_DN5572_c0_g1_i1.p1 TRINITY_DN5572_c0_g1~~TRINITY_DN5572_c0_g1_i1.p1  ORF type:complete len:2221 (+),score=691.16 TRINITY_DN5572_c0_g1_i1:420-7082(+)
MKTQQERQLLKEYHEKYPNSKAFENWSDNSISYDQHHAEWQLEKLLVQAQDQIRSRRDYYTKKEVDIVFPTQYDVPKLEEFREQRRSAIDKAGSSENPESYIEMSEILKDEVLVSGERGNDLPFFRDVLTQYFLQRRDYLIHEKYRHLLRWARYCTKTSVQERLRPKFTERLLAIENEHASVLDTVKRLSKHQDWEVPAASDAEQAKHKAAQHSNDVVNVADFRQYLRWQVYHYKTSKRVHRYFRKMQWLSYKSRFDIYIQAQELLSRRISVITENGAPVAVDARSLPLMQTQIHELDSTLEELKKYYGITTSVSSADGQEFFYYVNKKFTHVHSQQAAAMHFPVYESSSVYNKSMGQAENEKRAKAQSEADAAQGHGTQVEGQTSESNTFLKPANWLPFRKATPDIDESAALLKKKLSEIPQIDEQLRIESGFIDSDDYNMVTKRLKGQVETHRVRAAALPGRGAEIAAMGAHNPGPGGVGGGTSAALEEAIRIPETQMHQSVLYNSLPPHKLLAHYYLLYMRSRDFKHRSLHILNYFRSIERRFTIDEQGFAEVTKDDVEQGIDPLDRPKPSQPRAAHILPEEQTLSEADIMTLRGLENRDDRYIIDDNKILRVKDSNGVFVMYDAARDDLASVENELLRVGTHFINRHLDTNHPVEDQSHVADRLSMIADLWEAELWFQDGKRKVIDCYLEAYEHTLDPVEQERLRKVIVSLIHQRPRVDLEAQYFSESYASELVGLELHYKLLRQVMTSLIETEQASIEQIYAKVGQGGTTGLPHPPLTTTTVHNVSLVPGAKYIGIFDFFSSLALIAKIPVLMSENMRTLKALLKPKTLLEESTLTRALFQQAMVEWKMLLEDEKLVMHLDSEDEGIPLVRDSLLLEDPTAIELIANELFFEVSRSSYQERPDGLVQRVNQTMGIKDDISPTSLQVFCNTLEMVKLRKELLDTLYETEILTNIYRNQARAMGRDLRKVELGPINFEDAANTNLDEDDDTADLVELTEEDMASVATDYHPTFAIAEFEKAMAKFDFQSFAGVKRVIAGGGLDELRHAFQVQVLQKNMLIIVMQYNQISLDLFLRKYADDLLSQVRSKRTAGDYSKMFITALPSYMVNDPGTPRAGGEHSAAIKKQTELKRIRYGEMSKLSQFFVSLNQLKQQRRQYVLAAYADKSVRVLKTSKPEVVGKRLRELKYELISQFCNDMMSFLTPYVLKTQIHYITQQIHAMVDPLPNRNPFVAEKFMTQEERRKAEMPVPVAGRLARGRHDDTGDSSNRFIVTSDGKVNNVWYLPTYRDIMRMFSEEEDDRKKAENLRTCLNIVAAVHDITSFVKLTARLESASGEAIGGAMPSQEGIAHELIKIKNEIRNLLPDHTSPQVVVGYLRDKRLLMYARFQLALHELDQVFLERGNVEAREDVARTLRYLSHERPSSLYNTYLHSTEDESMERLFRYRTLDKSGAFVGALPRETFAEAAELYLLQFNASEVNTAVAQLGKIDLLLEDVLSESKVYRTSQPQDAVNRQLDFLHHSMTLIHLKNAFLFRSLGIKRFDRKEQLQQFNLVYEEVVMTRVLNSRGDDSETRSGEVIAGRPMTESQMRKAQISVLRQELDKLMLQEAHQEMSKLFGVIISEMDARGRYTGPNADLSTMTDQERDRVSKTALLHEFLQHFLSRVLETRTDEGRPAFLVTESHVATCVDRLATRLSEWGEERLRGRTKQLQLINQHLSHQLYVREQNIKHLVHQLDMDRRSFERRVQVVVADKNHDMIIEHEGVKRALSEAQSDSDKRAEALRESVMRDYEDLVRDLTLQLVLTKSKFKEYRTQVYQDMLGNLFDVKKEALMKMVEAGSAPLELKRKTWKIARMEDAQNQLKEENTELKKTILKLRTIHQMRDIATRATYEKKMRGLNEEKTIVHKSLWGNREETEQREIILRQQLLQTQNALTNAELELGQLRKDLELQNRNKAALVQWKVAKSQQLAELESKVKKYERWSSVDVDKLLSDLSKKEDDIKALSGLEKRAGKQSELQKNKNEKEIKRLTQALSHERRLKEQAFRKLDDLRATGRAPSAMSALGGGMGDIFDAELGDASRGGIDDLGELEMVKEELGMAEKENEIMRGVLRELGLTAPSIRGGGGGAGGKPMSRASTASRASMISDKGGRPISAPFQRPSTSGSTTRVPPIRPQSQSAQRAHSRNGSRPGSQSGKRPGSRGGSLMREPTPPVNRRTSSRG